MKLQEDLFLKNLSEQLSATVKVIPGVNRSLLQNNLQRLLSPQTGLREQLVLRNYTIGFNFNINKSESGFLFFFFKRKKREAEVVMDIKLNLGVAPVPDKPGIFEQILKPIVFMWQVPPFFVVDKGERQELAAATGTRVSSPLFLTDGGSNTLLIDFQKGGSKPTANLWFKGKRVDAEANKQWPALAFFTIYESIREWQTGEWKSQKIAPIELDNDNEVSQMVQVLAQAFRSTRETLIEEEKSAAESHWFDKIGFDYDLKNYQADIVLRLDEQGDLAVFNSKNSFQFALNMELSEKADHYEALLHMRIPDFLVEGDLYEAFWNIFLNQDESENYRDKLRKLLKKQGYILTDKELFGLLKRGKNGDGSVFRLDRDRKTDTNLFIVSGRVKQENVHLVFSGKFEVESVEKAQIRFKGKQSLNVHYFPEKNLIDQKLVDYYLRTIFYLKYWVDIL